ncbi:hypothetical protein QU481_23635 [Crenobacter sp. SG2303]|uniref:Uncharacterized protein n=1 Tax=Crenobacter oryzisoli TaxID=3056844 RepID=A0ABT7XVG7_9NEIS|nr:hypothetical protein [Crenobacter sp. SG2303]MDN0077791.1 hypothetical protein [Crenobacter sp. SG2303]
MKIQRNGSTPSVKGPQDWFIGTVRVDPPFPRKNRPAPAGDP